MERRRRHLISRGYQQHKVLNFKFHSSSLFTIFKKSLHFFFILLHFSSPKEEQISFTATKTSTFFPSHFKFKTSPPLVPHIPPPNVFMLLPISTVKTYTFEPIAVLLYLYKTLHKLTACHHILL